MTDSVFFDMATVLYRDRFPTYTSLISGNGAGGVAKAVPNDGASTRAALHATNTFFNCVNTNLREIYRNIPSCVRITGANGLNQSLSYGIMIDNAVSLTSGDLFDAFGQLWEIDEYHSGFRRIRQGDIDTKYNVTDGTGITDLTNRFESYQVDARGESDEYPTVCENLAGQGHFSLEAFGTVGVDYTGGTTALTQEPRHRPATRFTSGRRPRTDRTGHGPVHNYYPGCLRAFITSRSNSVANTKAHSNSC